MSLKTEIMRDMAEIGRDIGTDRDTPYTFTWSSLTINCVPTSTNTGTTLVLGGEIVDIILQLTARYDAFTTLPVAGETLVYSGDSLTYRILQVRVTAARGTVELTLGDTDKPA